MIFFDFDIDIAEKHGFRPVYEISQTGQGSHSLQVVRERYKIDPGLRIKV